MPTAVNRYASQKPKPEWQTSGPSHLDLHCLHKYLYKSTELKELVMDNLTVFYCTYLNIYLFNQVEEMNLLMRTLTHPYLAKTLPPPPPTLPRKGLLGISLQRWPNQSSKMAMLKYQIGSLKANLNKRCLTRLARQTKRDTCANSVDYDVSSGSAQFAIMFLIFRLKLTFGWAQKICYCSYSWLSLSRTRLSRITAYLEVKLLSLP